MVVAASHGVAPSPGLLVRALGAGAVPVASHLGSYEEVVCRDADLGLLFEPGDVDTLAAQLERLIRDDGAARRAARERRSARTTTSTGRAWRRASRRSTTRSPRAATPPRATPEVAARLADRPLIDVDLHMHTDHSSDCATPVDVLLATARDAGPRRDRGHRPQRDLRRATTRARRRPSSASR